MRPLSRRELIDSSKASLATLFDTAASRMPSHGAPLPSLSSVAMISRTLNSVGSDRREHRAGLGRVDATPADDRTEDGRLELRESRRRLGLVLARVDAERARRVGDAGAPHRLDIRPDVLDVRDYADDEDAVHL